MNHDVFVIAEAGVNHNGSVDLAHQLIDVAASLGADAVKFQTFDADSVVAAGTDTVEYQARTTGAIDQHTMLRDLELGRSAWRDLAAHCSEAGIEFMSTAFDLTSLELLLEAGVTRLKIPSGELTNHPFIRVVADQGLPLIISTGMGTMAETLAAAEAAAAAPGRCILHCVSAYPAPLEEANLSVLPALRAATGCEIGWSDHCAGTTAVRAAVALGATVVERHLTLDHTMVGPDHAASDDPAEFEAYLKAIRSTTNALGDGVKRPTESEMETRRLARRSWHAVRQLTRGMTVTDDDLVALRPAAGIAPSVDIVGATMLADVAAGRAITDDDVRLPGRTPVR